MPGDLGQLEKAVMAVLWDGDALSVRQVQARLRQHKRAYTTVMTTLDRLHTKGLLSRERDGNAYVYRVTKSQQEHHRDLARRLAGDLIPRGGEAILAGFVDEAARIDAENLDRLERLIAERRQQTAASDEQSPPTPRRQRK